MKIFVLNPGSTSTKCALFEGNILLWEANIQHKKSDLLKYKTIIEQKNLRKKTILAELKKHDTKVEQLDAVISRGGLLASCESGVYKVDQAMLYDLANAKYGEHASNLGAILANEIAEPCGMPAFIMDPPVVDEMDEIAKITGLPEVKRKSIFHVLNQKAVARSVASSLGLKYEEINVIVAHMGGGISIGAHKKGRVVDVNNALEGDGPMTPERTGYLPAASVISLIIDGKYTPEELLKTITKRGGIYAHLGTTDIRQVFIRIEKGDEKASLIIDAMAYQITKAIGAMAAVLKGKIDAIILTGGLAKNAAFSEKISEYVGFFGKVFIIDSLSEMSSLAAGALRVLTGQKQLKTYKKSG